MLEIMGTWKRITLLYNRKETTEPQGFEGRSGALSEAKASQTCLSLQLLSEINICGVLEVDIHFSCG